MDKTTQKSCFGQWLDPIDANEFQSIVNLYGGDRYVRKLTVWKLLQLMLFAQLKRAAGLRELEIAVQNNSELASQLELDSISISQLSRTCERVDPSIFRDLFLKLVDTATQSMRREPRHFETLGIVKAIDSTTIPLCLSKYRWAKFRKTKAGVKVHTRLTFADPCHAFPDAVTITPARVADSKTLATFVDNPDAIYVFDRGYLDYTRFDTFCTQKIRFASRLKNNTVYEFLCEHEVEAGSVIKRDMWVRLGSGQKVMNNTLRRIVTEDSRGKRIVIVTNDLFSPAEELSELYLSRWQIELFFKWLKQNLKVTTFFGTSARAVENQIYIALITYLLTYLARVQYAVKQDMLTLQRLLRELLWKSWSKMKDALNRKPTRTSKGRQKRRD